ncbi:transcriptional regulator, Crp/Fnr family [Xylanimonas cellulosilytica DSM 15894]|uniref:Transcriptional regulator, Crp/Fnr family n=1 Tax=Xylanimonas cellulosilytica (strain DSM 15894 / JCM 12276 / CECT 5975 / KCTC 9989 / LMG 20990 / NBRC 107835 / XIL07) TaxID=446471 RepID=D1BT16_XYLCX|nr:Crp/Fnr family transcriptional regulator [Xylanimonas cellulosilytica]ACZ30858.1 transcriptional regulator, Crp/Fnr family [Xylanimonas cellulosilytica DSM 15894]
MADTCVALVPVFAGLTPGQQAEVARFARPVHAAAGEVVARAGVRASQLFVVHTGRLTVRRVSAGGHETIVRVVGPGEVTGEEAFLTGAAPDTDTVAVVDTRLCRFDHADLADLLARMPGIGVGMLRALAEKLTSAERMVAALASADVGARVAAYLLDLPTAWEDGRAVVRLPLPKFQVAAHLGTTPETLSRRLATFEREGLVELLPGRAVAILDPARLGHRGTPT